MSDGFVSNISDGYIDMTSLSIQWTKNEKK